MKGTNHKCIRKLMMKPYRAEKATQVEITNSNTLPEIISQSSLWNTLALLTGFNCGSKTQKKAKKPKPTLLFNLFCCENDKHLPKLNLYSQHRLGMKMPWTWNSMSSWRVPTAVICTARSIKCFCLERRWEDHHINEILSGLGVAREEEQDWEKNMKTTEGKGRHTET